MFATPDEYIQATQQRLDLLLQRAILRLRAVYQLSLDEFRGLYISDEQVDDLVRQVAANDNTLSTIEELTRQAALLGQTQTTWINAWAQWVHLIAEFDLTPLEADALLLVMAPEINAKYETIYAYLNNDVTRKWATPELILRVLPNSPTEKLALRSHLLPGARLFNSGLLQPLAGAGERPGWLASGLCAAPILSHFLLGLPVIDLRLTAHAHWCELRPIWDDLPLTAVVRQQIRRLPTLFAGGPGPLLFFCGRPGAGRLEAAAAFCTHLGIALLRIDLTSIRSAAPSDANVWHKVGQALVLQARLARSGLYLEAAETLFEPEGKPLPELQALLRTLAGLPGPVVLACAPDTAGTTLGQAQRSLTITFADPPYAERRHWWASFSAQANCQVTEAEIDALANRFVLTPGEMRNAIQSAQDAQALAARPDAAPTFADLMSAARTQSDHHLGRLAVKVSLTYTWDDLVLPPVTFRQVKAIAAAIANQHIVYAQWGFGRRIAAGKGMKVLFAGASGTGKTMTAAVIARDLGLDLYKIDLSGVVSKYIGETEKNLDRIFGAAHNSSALLFFDEADALFGKRSEVKDAHDRYANIEVAYLLQKLEEHEGAVILASNLSKNIDNAFARRMHTVIEFPLPDETHRAKLWRGIFPPEAPLAQDVDFAFLAKQFQIAGGDIKNVALEAAFLAAQDGQVVRMEQVVKAMARQMIKQGRVPSTVDFKQYHPLIGQE